MFKVWSAQSSGKSRRLRDGCKLRLIARIRIFGTSTPQFHTSVPYKDHTFSAPKIPQFNTKIPQFHTENPSVPHQKLLSSTDPTEGFSVRNRGVFGFLNSRVFGVELRATLRKPTCTDCTR